MKLRTYNHQRERACAWCGAMFRARRNKGVEARFCKRPCFTSAKQANGVIRRESV